MTKKVKDELYWLNCFSDLRYGLDEKKKSARSEFERDYDRIIFSSAFRRLQNKTQVFPLPKHVFVHNRLTHSLEVASVGRSLGKIVGNYISNLTIVKNNTEVRRFYRNQLKNVIAAGALAHDLGNPAFGHSGEEAISKYFKENKDGKLKKRFTKTQWADLTNFEGNANALRILTRQYKGRLKGGFRLTYSTLSSILKYPCASTQATGNDIPLHLKKYGYFQTEEKVFKEIVSLTGMKPDVKHPGAYFRHPFVYLVEAADDICYNIIDFEDAHRLGILDRKTVIDSFIKIIECNKDEDLKHVKNTSEQLKEDSNEQIAYLRAKAINYLILACAKEFIDNKDSIASSTYQGSLYKNIKEPSKIIKEIEAISYKYIYNYPSVAKIELAGFEIMSTLIEKFTEAALTHKDKRIKRHKKVLELLPNQHRFDEKDSDYEKAMCIIDYIAGMTDLFALELYNNITGIEMPTF